MGYDHVEENMGYEHIVVVMSALLETMRHERPEKKYNHFCYDQ